MKELKFRRILWMAAVFALLTASGTTAAFASSGENPILVHAASLTAATSTTALLAESGLQRIQFATGATSAVVSGNLAANSTARYVLRALAGQLMDVTLSAPEGVSLTVTRANGRTLNRVTGSSTSFRGYLPATGDYVLTVRSAGQSVAYSINVSIPQRVAFKSGATSATIQGHLAANQSLDYILRANAGQIMEINATPDNSLQLIIFGVDGTVLKSGMGGGSSFRGELPVSEDYIVTVRAGAEAKSFTLNVIIPRRIVFRAGAIGAVLNDSISANQSQYYVLKALKNQTMSVRITPANSVQLIIYGADGTVLRSGMGEGTSFSGTLPSTQDYIVVVRAGTNPILYRFRVTIQ